MLPHREKAHVTSRFNGNVTQKEKDVPKTIHPYKSRLSRPLPARNDKNHAKAAESYLCMII